MKENRHWFADGKHFFVNSKPILKREKNKETVHLTWHYEQNSWCYPGQANCSRCWCYPAQANCSRCWCYPAQAKCSRCWCYPAQANCSHCWCYQRIVEQQTSTIRGYYWYKKEYSPLCIVSTCQASALRGSYRYRQECLCPAEVDAWRGQRSVHLQLPQLFRSDQCQYDTGMASPY